MRRADCRDLLQTAQTLGLDKKYEIVFKLITDINDSTGGAALNFEEFVKQLTDRLVSNLLFRETHSVRKEDTRTSNFSMLLLKTNFPLMT